MYRLRCWVVEPEVDGAVPVAVPVHQRPCFPLLVQGQEVKQQAPGKSGGQPSTASCDMLALRAKNFAQS